MHSRGPFLIAIALAATFTGGGCADFTRGPPLPVEDAGQAGTTDGGGTLVDGGAALGFAADVHPVLIASCQSCHSSGGSASDTAWLLSGDASTDYAATITIVDEAAPTQSRLLTKGAGLGHVGGALLPTGSDEYELILTWIQQGALP